MRARVWMVGLVALGSVVAGAQSNSPSASQQALGWLQSEWKSVQKQGRAAADRVVREYPQRFKAIKVRVSRLSEVAGQMADTTRLDEKRRLIEQLWEVRGSLDLLALCSPDVIHQITGLDTAGLASLQSQVVQLRKRLGG